MIQRIKIGLSTSPSSRHATLRALDGYFDWIVCEHAPATFVLHQRDLCGYALADTSANTAIHTPAWLPVIHIAALRDPMQAENYFERVSTLARWQVMLTSGLSAKKLIDFHARHKYSVLARGQGPYRQLGRYMANVGHSNDLTQFAEHYLQLLMAALQRPATIKHHSNVLQHMLGYLKQQLNRNDKHALLNSIDAYRRGETSQLAPLTLLRSYLQRHPHPYLINQTYLQPYPDALLRRHAHPSSVLSPVPALNRH